MSCDAAWESEELLRPHLAGCSACAQQWQLMSELRAPEAPAGLTRRVMAELDRREAFRTTGAAPSVWRQNLGAVAFNWLTRGAAAGALLSFCVLGFWLGWLNFSSGPDVAVRDWQRWSDAREHQWLLQQLGPEEKIPSDTSSRGTVARLTRGALQ